MTIGGLATALLAKLNELDDDDVNPLGITGAEYAERGKMQTVIGPAALLWLEPGSSQRAHSGAYALDIRLHIFCISSPAISQAAALDEAYTIALKVLALLDGKTVSGAYIESGESPVELVESDSNAAIVAVNLTTSLSLA